MLERIEKVLNEYKGVTDLKVTAEMTFSELELDSLDTVELIMNLEEEFGVTIETGDGITNIGQLMDVLQAAQ